MQEFFIDFLKKQGAFTLLLIFLSWQLYQKMERLENQIQICNDDKFKSVTELANRCNLVLERNTAALQENTEVLETIIETRKPKIKILTAREGIK